MASPPPICFLQSCESICLCVKCIKVKAFTFIILKPTIKNPAIFQLFFSYFYLKSSYFSLQLLFFCATQPIQEFPLSRTFLRWQWLIDIHSNFNGLINGNCYIMMRLVTLPSTIRYLSSENALISHLNSLCPGVVFRRQWF